MTVPKSKTGEQSASQVVVAPSAVTSTDPLPVMSMASVRRSNVNDAVTSRASLIATSQVVA